MGGLIRRTPEEKLEIIHLVEHSSLSVKRTLEEIEVPRSTFYRWYGHYQEDGPDGLQDRKPNPRSLAVAVLSPPPALVSNPHTPPPDPYKTPLLARVFFTILLYPIVTINNYFEEYLQ